MKEFRAARSHGKGLFSLQLKELKELVLRNHIIPGRSTDDMF